jgi:hypothetical protein
MNKNFVGIALFATLGAIAMSAQASTPPPLNGYVCSVSWVSPKQNSAFGQFGGLSGSVTTSPFCQGTQVGTYAIYSTGQTQDSNAWSFTETQLFQTFGGLRDAMNSGKRVNMSAFSTTSAFGGYSSIVFQGG